MGRPGYDIKGCKFGKLQVLGKSQYKMRVTRRGNKVVVNNL